MVAAIPVTIAMKCDDDQPTDPRSLICELLA